MWDRAWMLRSGSQQSFSSPGAQHDLKKHEQAVVVQVQARMKIHLSRDNTDRQALYQPCHL